MLEDVKELAAENEKLEAKMVEVASAQNDAMQANYDYTNSQLQNARETRDDYKNVSWELKELDALNAWTTSVGNTQDVDVPRSWASSGLDTGEQEARDLLFDIARRRGEINRDYELRNMNRRIENLEKARIVADKQRTTAQKQLQAPDGHLKIPHLWPPQNPPPKWSQR